jgi:hypothetical protein
LCRSSVSAVPSASHFAASNAIYFEHPVLPSLRQTLLHASLQGESSPVEGLSNQPSGCADLLPMLCRSIQRGDSGLGDSADVNRNDWSSGAVSARLAPHRVPCQNRRVGVNGVEVSVCLLANVQRTAKVDHRVFGDAAWNRCALRDVSKRGNIYPLLLFSFDSNTVVCS